MLEEEEEIMEEEVSYIKMDYSLEDPKDRVKKVNEIIANTPKEKLTNAYLDRLATYIIEAMTKEEKQEKKILTANRMLTLNKRETSFEGLVGKLENGEDGIYNMITNDKNIIFKPKTEITEKDLVEIPGLRDLRQAILELEDEAKKARGKRAFQLKKQIIDLRQDQYIIRSAYKKPIYSSNIIKTLAKLDLSEKITIDAEGQVHSTGLINFFDERHISILLCNYSKLKEYSWDKLTEDMKWMLMDFDDLVNSALKYKHPMYYDLVIYKIDGRQNAEIQLLLQEKYGIKHSVEYISSLWRNKIPKLLVEQATNEYLEWHYTHVEKGKWKRCTRCGQLKLAHNNFFSKNKTSKDGFYSICKECRNKK